MNEQVTWLVQTGKNKSSYKTRYSFKSWDSHSSHRIWLYYASIIVHSGYKKRLVRDGIVIAREISS